MFISENGLNLIKKFEGCVLKAYDDYNGKIAFSTNEVKGTLTIGYGHIENVQVGDEITQQQADQLLKTDMKKYCDYVQTAIDKGIISFQVNQNMFDSLVSFVYNLGYSNLCLLCNSRTSLEVSEHMTAYINKGSQWEQGLLKRRQAEKDLFLKECENKSEGEYEMSKTYKNGSTIENVYAEDTLQTKIGSLNSYEECQALGECNGKIIVYYETPTGHKVGFVKYRGGL